MNIAAQAAQLAFQAHLLQFDKVGEPYINHPRAVAETLVNDGEDEHTIALGWLHDVVEDTPVTLDNICAWFGPEMAHDVDAITHRKGETNDDYYARVRARPRALTVKFADIKHNTDPDRMAQLDEVTRARLARKYAHALDVLR